MTIRGCALLLGLLTACTSASVPREETPESPEPAAAAPPPSSPPSPAPHAPSVATAAPAPVEITNVLPGRFAITSKDGIGLDPRAIIEKQGKDGQWSALTGLELGRGFALRLGCDREPEPCVQLGAGRELSPVPLTGMSCSSQCNQSCDKNAWLGAGSYRLTVRTCDGKPAASGPAFALPAEHHDAEQLLRWGLGEELVSGTIMRLDVGRARDEVDAVGTPGKLGGHPITKRSERALDAESLAQLRALLQDRNGYEDRLARRCAHTMEVGLRLVRAPATTGAAKAQIVDVLLDFPCQRIWFVVGDDARAVAIRGGSIFDPSEKGWFAFLRRALPDDRDVAKLE